MRRTLLILLAGACLCGCSESDGLTMNGGYCVFNDDCRSNYCEDGICRMGSGGSNDSEQTGSILNGHACTMDSQCASGNCYEGKICRTPNWGGSQKLEIGDSCTLDSQCSSKSCKDNICVSSGIKIVNGQACTSDEQCESGNCYEGKVCRTPNWGGDTKLDVGSVCSGDSNCVSGNCVSGVCNPAGVTDAKTANGLACSSNDQCATSNCYEGKVCRTPNWGGTSNKVGNGKACTSDEQCVSNNCYEGKVCRSPNWGSTEKLEVGDACTSNDQCASNYCYNNTVCRSNSGSGGDGSISGSTSDANLKYCDALINVCEDSSMYRSYEGCVDTMALLRDIAPECRSEWDAAYKCISSATCSDIRTHDKPLSELSEWHDLNYWVPDACVTLASMYQKCKYR